MADLTKRILMELPHERAKSKSFTMSLGDLPTRSMRRLTATTKGPGGSTCSPTRRVAITSMVGFPQAYIEWRELPPGLPADRRDMRVNVWRSSGQQEPRRLRSSRLEYHRR